jgi:hypothetical protein
MGINYHWISRMVYLISDVGNLLMMNFLPYLTSSQPLIRNGIQANMTKTSMTLRNFMILVKMTTKNIALISMGSIAIVRLPIITPPWKKSSTTRVGSLILVIKLMTYSILSIPKQSMTSMGYIHQKCLR